MTAHPIKPDPTNYLWEVLPCNLNFLLIQTAHSCVIQILELLLYKQIMTNKLLLYHLTLTLV